MSSLYGAAGVVHDPELTRVLLEAGADPNAEPRFGDALYHAVEAELTGEVCRRGLRIYQLPIAYYGRTYAEGKKITWRDGVKAALVLVQVRLRRREGEA